MSDVSLGWLRGGSEVAQGWLAIHRPVGVLLELGKIPLNIYLERIKGKNANDLLLSSYDGAVNENLI